MGLGNLILKVYVILLWHSGFCRKKVATELAPYAAKRSNLLIFMPYGASSVATFRRVPN
jgi:hypothetical protein